METTHVHRNISGLHLTAISGPARANVDCYTGVLKQRIVKKTIIFDAPDTYWKCGHGVDEPQVIGSRSLFPR